MIINSPHGVFINCLTEDPRRIGVGESLSRLDSIVLHLARQELGESDSLGEILAH
jgi:hypothetical protein